ncbi:MAG: NusG domain II-containing protein [Bacilli bacterium]
MKKNDVGLIIVLLILNTVWLVTIIKPSSNVANVYYNQQLIMKLDLNKDAKYDLDGANGEVELTVSNGKVAVTKETSPLNICAKQGYVDVAKIPLICLPNKVVVEGATSEVDGVAR